MNPIPVKRFHGNKPAIGYTDWSAVHISWLVPAGSDAYLTLHKHECGHIWLQHQLRTADMRKAWPEPLDRRLWNIALDMEIAKHLYSDVDRAVIEAPRSWLNGGITQKHCEQYPDCQYAEEYYAALLEKPLEDDGADSHDGDAMPEDGDGDGAGQSEPDAAKDREPMSGDQLRQLVDAAVDAAGELMAAHNEATATKEAKKYRPRPTLASVLDHKLGRPALDRVASYRRPPRHEREGGIIRKGVVLKRTAPRVMIYVDRSGSFTPAKTAAAEDALKAILRKYRASVQADTWRFSDYVSSAECPSGGTNYAAVLEHIENHNPELAIVVTDDDHCPVGLKLKDARKRIVVIPVGCSATNLARVIGATEISL